MIAEPSPQLPETAVAEIVKVLPLVDRVIPVPADKPTVPVRPRILRTAEVIPDTAVAVIVNVLPLGVILIPVPADKPTVPVRPLIRLTVSDVNARVPLLDGKLIVLPAPGIHDWVAPTEEINDILFASITDLLKLNESFNVNVGDFFVIAWLKVNMLAKFVFATSVIAPVPVEPLIDKTPVLEIVKAPLAPDTAMPVEALKVLTPVLVIVILPVEPVKEIPVDPVSECTPVLAIIILLLLEFILIPSVKSTSTEPVNPFKMRTPVLLIV